MSSKEVTEGWALSKTTMLRCFQSDHTMSMITEDVPLCNMRGVACSVVAHQSPKSSPAMGRVELDHIQDSTSCQNHPGKGEACEDVCQRLLRLVIVGCGNLRRASRSSIQCLSCMAGKICSWLPLKILRTWNEHSLEKDVVARHEGLGFCHPPPQHHFWLLQKLNIATVSKAEHIAKRQWSPCPLLCRKSNYSQPVPQRHFLGILGMRSGAMYTQSVWLYEVEPSNMTWKYASKSPMLVSQHDL
jgi:hypothetical protein